MKKIYWVRVYDEYGKLTLESWWLVEPKKYIRKLEQRGNQVLLLSFLAWENEDE